MEIVHLLRRWRFALRAYSNARKYTRVSQLRDLLGRHANIDSFIVSKERLLVRLKNKAVFEWNHHKPNSFLIATNENYELLERELIKKILKPEDVVFDIGANFGYFSVLMKLFCPSIVLFIFEPIRETYQTLLRNLQYNELNNVKTFNIGFANESGPVTFYVPEQLGDAWASMGTGVSSVFNYKLNSEIAEVERLDDFVIKHNIKQIDFIKCDVEGAEKLVVEGGIETLKMHHPTLMLEIGNMWTEAFGYNREILIKMMLDDFGYRCFGILADQVIVIDAEIVQNYPEQQMYNYFFVHPSKEDVMKLMLSYIGKEHNK